MAAEVTLTAPYEAKQGDPLRCIPIRNTDTGTGVAEDVDVKGGLRHICLHASLAATADFYTFGRTVKSAAFHAEGGLTSDVTWDPDDSTGKITIAISGGGAGTGWLHIWSYD
jgi:hypothetical protein